MQNLQPFSTISAFFFKHTPRLLLHSHCVSPSPSLAFPPNLPATRGARHPQRELLRLLRCAVPGRDLCGDPAAEDPVLRPEPADPLRAARRHDPADVPAARQLWGENQPG